MCGKFENKKAVFTRMPQSQSLDLFPYSIHLGMAKLVDSAMLKPWLNPEW